jgi:NADP-dependent 3-hydroxy acid dehydrogenase YdfG
MNPKPTTPPHGMARWAGCTALVTGASSGIAEAVVYMLPGPEHVQVHDILLRPTEQPG